MEQTAIVVLPKSPMGHAIAYAQRQWPPSRFNEHGLNIDNNAAERALRGVAIGRKNYLFARADNGGSTALLYTMTQSCKRHGIEPPQYVIMQESSRDGYPYTLTFNSALWTCLAEFVDSGSSDLVAQINI